MLLLAIALGTPLAFAREFLIPYTNAGVVPFPDADAYLAAGERLNAGHELFRRQPGDREVAYEELFPAPILSPPPIAVLWRPLAGLSWGFNAWVAASWVALLGTIAYLVLKTGLPAAILTLALSVVVGQSLVIANVAAFFPAVFVLAWRYRRVPWVGVGIGLISAIKLTPIAMTGWMVGDRLWRMLAFTTGTIGVVAVIGGLGAGFDSYLEYVGIARQIKATHDSIAGLSGIPWASYAVLGGGMVLAALLGGRWPKWSFAVAVVASTIGIPVLYPTGLVPLLALAAPLIPEPAPTAISAKAGTAGAPELRPG